MYKQMTDLENLLVIKFWKVVIMFWKVEVIY